ncbi:MAG: hypothetical protein NT040_19880 [Bacteroidetes bacterium]|nr:hypothetical protein [Bacteroidota bacterium]
MKTIRKISEQDFIDNRSEISNRQVMVPRSKLLAGSLLDKYPVTLDGGKTIIFIADKSKESETRQRYELQVANRFMKFIKKPKP